MSAFENGGIPPCCRIGREVWIMKNIVPISTACGRSPSLRAALSRRRSGFGAVSSASYLLRDFGVSDRRHDRRGIRSGSFSLGNFYKRRILRILPALFVMFLVTRAGLYLLPAGRARGLLKKPCKRGRFVSNIYFAQTADYSRRPPPKPAASAPPGRWRGGAVLSSRSFLMLVAYRFGAEARQTSVCCRRALSLPRLSR